MRGSDKAYETWTAHSPTARALLLNAEMNKQGRICAMSLLDDIEKAMVSKLQRIAAHLKQMDDETDEEGNTTEVAEAAAMIRERIKSIKGDIDTTEEFSLGAFAKARRAPLHGM